MALQGTLETFALPDVLRLLASTKKTGCYRLDGNRGMGMLWVKEGKIVGGSVNASPSTDITEIAFELLRFVDGDFVFDQDAEPAESSEAIDVETVLEGAEKALEEWKEIEAVVPSLDSFISLRAELPQDEVTIRADKWLLITVIGGGLTVGRLGAMLGLGELPVSRSVKELSELGLIELGEAPAGAATAAAPLAAVAEPAPQPEPEPEPALTLVDNAAYELADDAVVEFAPFGSSDVTDDPFAPFDPNGLVVEEPRIPTTAEMSSSPLPDVDFGDTIEPAAFDEPAAEAAPPPPEPAAQEADPGDAAEIARQLANLSPKAAKAVAAAAKATTQAEREAALAEVDESEDPINRELLLKFLGSVNS